MALLDRLKDATRPSNSIEAVEPQQSQPLLRAAVAVRPNGETVAVTVPPEGPQPSIKKGDAKAAAYTTEPESIAKSYYVEERGGERRYYDDYQRKSLAIRSDAGSISSKKEDLNTVRSMLDLAEARGWGEVKINGSADFKREMWIEAQARGLQTQGYKASDLDRQEADRRRGERPQAGRPEQDALNVVRQGSGVDTPAAQPKGQVSGQQEPVAERPRPAPANDQQSVRAASSARQDTPAEPGRPAEPLHSAKGAPVPAGDQQPAKDPQSARQDAPAEPGRQGEPLHSAKGAPALAGDQQQVKGAGNAPEKGAQAPSLADNRRNLREANAELSPDGRLMLGALSENIDRKMNKLNVEAKAEMKAFVATELVKKERAEGPIVLSAEQRNLATAPEPTRQQPTQPVQQQPEPTRRMTPEEPRLSRGR